MPANLQLRQISGSNNLTTFIPMTPTSHHFAPNPLLNQIKKLRGGRSGEIVLDHIRTVDKQRLVKKLGAINPTTQHKTLSVLQEMFFFIDV